jgi:hypothetical protein
VSTAHKAESAAELRRLIREADRLPIAEQTAVHRLIAFVSGGELTVFGFLNEIAKDISADAWLAQSGPQDDGDDDIARLRFTAWKRAQLLVELTEMFANEEFSEAEEAGK